MKIVIIIFTILFSANSYAQFANMATRLYIDTQRGYSLDKLVFGIHKDATNSLDTELNEFELPPFPPPEGIHAGFIVYDTNQNENVMTYIDKRPYPRDEQDTVVFVLQTFKGSGDLITFRWNPIGPEILSAFIYDRVTDGKVVAINMKDSTSAFISNEFIERFNIKVVYNQGTNVKETDNNSELIVSPTFFSESIKISNADNYYFYMLIDMAGRTMQTGKIVDGEADINTSDIASGAYILIVRGQSQFVSSKMIIKN